MFWLAIALLPLGGVAIGVLVQRAIEIGPLVVRPSTPPSARAIRRGYRRQRADLRTALRRAP